MNDSLREDVARAMCPDNWGARDFTETANGEEPEEQREYWRERAAAALSYLKPGSRWTDAEGREVVVVPQSALDWLNGEGDDFERPEGVRGNFWWRTEFRRRAMLRACAEEKTSDG